MRGSALIVLAACGGGTPAPVGPKLEPGTHRLTIEPGVDVVYDVRGSGKTPCIAHPGGPGLSSEYLHIPAFEKRFTMVFIDPLGTSGSSKLPADQVYSRERDVAVVEALREKLGIDKACLIGHSYGGEVMLSYAATHPDHVGSLFLYSTTPTNAPDFESQAMANTSWFKDQPFHADAMKALEDEPKAADKAALDAVIQRLLPLYFADWSGQKSRYAALVAKLEVDFDVFRRRPVGTKANAFDVRGKLGRLHTATAVIVTGDKDFLCGPKPSTWIVQSIANSKLIVIPEAGHFAHLEQPGAFDDAVATFATLVR